MNEINDREVTHRRILEEGGFRKRGCTMFRIIGHQEIRYLCIDRDMYAYEGTFGVFKYLNEREGDKDERD